MKTEFQTSRGFKNMARLPVFLIPALLLAWIPEASATPDAKTCVFSPIQVPSRPSRLNGTVIRMISPAQAEAITRRVEHETGGMISPDYSGLPRIEAEIVTPRRTFKTVATVIDGHIPQPGDHVDILTRYRDPRLACHFIPWTVQTPAAVS